MLKVHSNKGQVRVFEAVAAATIIFMSFSAAILLIRPQHSWAIREVEDLDRLGYNILHNLIENGAIESILRESSLNASRIKLKTLLEGIIPIMTYYNLTIFVRDEGGAVELKYYVSVSNARPEVFLNSPEVSSATAIYTSRSGRIYYIIIMLVKGGG